MTAAAPWSRLGIVALVVTAGCATASPTLVSARVLAPSRVELDLGSVYVAPVAQTALTGSQSAGASREARIRGAVAFAAQPPGLAPFVQGRVGLGGRAEGSVAVLGRFLRMGARRELLREGNWTLTAGAHARFAFLATDATTPVPGLSLEESRVYGGELTLQLGYTRRDIYDLWATLRSGYLYGDGRVRDPGTGSSELRAHRLEGALALGMRIAFGRFGIGVELEAQYAWSSGGDGTLRVQADQLALVPAGALVVRF